MKIYFLIVPIIAIMAFGAPLLALAHSQAVWQPYWGPILSCTGNYADPKGQSAVTSDAVKETCRSFCDMLHTFQHIVYLVITVALFAITPLAFAIGGGMMLISGGNPERITEGRKLITATVIGVILVLLSYAIVQTMIYVLDLGSSFGGGEGPGVHWGEVTCNAENNTLAPGSATP